MDTLQISGKWYISSRRAAKEYGYHADYIGQLIRSGKVKGQKVGRSWYALSDSLADYFGSEKVPAPAKEEEAKLEPKEMQPEPQMVDEVPAVREETAVEEPITEAAAIVEEKEEATPMPVQVRTEEKFYAPAHQAKDTYAVKLTYMREEEPKLEPFPATHVEKPVSAPVVTQATIEKKVDTLVPEILAAKEQGVREARQQIARHTRQSGRAVSFIKTGAFVAILVGVTVAVSIMVPYSISIAFQ